MIEFSCVKFRSVLICKLHELRSIDRFSLCIPKGRSTIFKPDRLIEEYSFEGLGFDPALIERLDKIKVKIPTQIQLLGIPAIRMHPRVIIGGETGSGKTLAFLFPIMEQIKKSETRTQDRESTIPNHPKVIVLVPTNELALQVKSVAKFLGKSFKLRTQAFFHSMKMKYYKSILENPVDILVLTPSKLVNLQNENKILLSHLSHVIVDEGDSLLDDDADFGRDISKIFQSFITLNINPHVIICTATITVAFEESIKKIENILPNSTQFVHVISPGLHKPPLTMKQTFLKISEGGNEKQRRITSIIKANPNDRILVFCDKIASMETLRNHFHLNGINHYSWEKEEHPDQMPTTPLYDCIHGHLSVLKRKQLLDEFQDSKFNVLIASGLTGRGLDFKMVHHVILYDFPKNPIDYLHRIGRTARGGSTGRVTSFVTASTKEVSSRIHKFISRNNRITGNLHDSV